MSKTPSWPSLRVEALRLAGDHTVRLGCDDPEAAVERARVYERYLAEAPDPVARAT